MVVSQLVNIMGKTPISHSTPAFDQRRFGMLVMTMEAWVDVNYFKHFALELAGLIPLLVEYDGTKQLVVITTACDEFDQLDINDQIPSYKIKLFMGSDFNPNHSYARVIAQQ